MLIIGKVVSFPGLVRSGVLESSTATLLDQMIPHYTLKSILILINKYSYYPSSKQLFFTVNGDHYKIFN